MTVAVVTDEGRDRPIAAWEQVLALSAPAGSLARVDVADTAPREHVGAGGRSLPGRAGGSTVTVTIEFGPDQHWAYARPGPGMAP